MITKQSKSNPLIAQAQRIALLGVLLSVVLNSVGQILFKTARAAQPDASLMEIFLRFETWLAFGIYGLSAICWLWVLARVQLSLAYPILALTFPIVVGLSAFFFGETISLMRWGGVAAIVIGVSLLART
jgi:drug/metabolite transporter (DMT)-like permease